MQHNMSLLAYHLPLDAHSQLGNNAQLGKLLGVEEVTGFASQSVPSLGLLGVWPSGLAGSQVVALLNEKLGRMPQHIAAGPSIINRVGWCTGAAQSYIDLAADAGADAFLAKPFITLATS